MGIMLVINAEEGTPNEVLRALLKHTEKWVECMEDTPDLGTQSIKLHGAPKDPGDFWESEEVPTGAKWVGWWSEVSTFGGTENLYYTIEGEIWTAPN